MTAIELAQKSPKTLKNEAFSALPQAIYKAGNLVPASGLYAELAANGFKMGEITCLHGENFPANQHPSFSYQLIIAPNIYPAMGKD